MGFLGRGVYVWGGSLERLVGVGFFATNNNENTVRFRGHFLTVLLCPSSRTVENVRTSVSSSSRLSNTNEYNSCVSKRCYLVGWPLSVSMIVLGDVQHQVLQRRDTNQYIGHRIHEDS